MEAISDSVFSGCNALIKVRCREITPPTVLATSFDEYTYTHAALAVPPTALAKYSANSVWSKFITVTGVNTVLDDATTQIYVSDGRLKAPEGTIVYDMRGIRKKNEYLEPGVYIVVMPDNTTVKIAVGR